MSPDLDAASGSSSAAGWSFGDVVVLVFVDFAVVVVVVEFVTAVDVVVVAV